jgi:hypothetical protein
MVLEFTESLYDQMGIIAPQIVQNDWNLSRKFVI